MSDHERAERVVGRQLEDDRTVEALLRLAEPRQVVPADRLARLRESAHGEWRRQVSRARRRRWFMWSAGGLAAAAVFVALRPTAPVAPESAPGRALATVATARGAVLLVAAGDRQATGLLRVGDGVPAGQGAATLGDGSATLQLSSGAMVRLDSSSAVRLDEADVLSLIDGAIYVETDGAQSVQVRTRLGDVRDVGTRFEVRIGDAGLRVRVREGAVNVRRGDQQHEADAGSEIALDREGRATRRIVLENETPWAWVSDQTSPFDIEGRSLGDFLDWIARENRWQLRFADAAIEDRARATTLHGSIRGLSAEQALAAVVPVSGLAHRLERRVLLIERSSAGKD